MEQAIVKESIVKESIVKEDKFSKLRLNIEIKKILHRNNYNINNFSHADFIEYKKLVSQR